METLAQLKKQYPHLANQGWYLRERINTQNRQAKIDSENQAKKTEQTYLKSLLAKSLDGDNEDYSYLQINNDGYIIAVSEIREQHRFRYETKVNYRNTLVIVPHWKKQQEETAPEIQTNDATFLFDVIAEKPEKGQSPLEKLDKKLKKYGMKPVFETYQKEWYGKTLTFAKGYAA